MSCHDALDFPVVPEVNMMSERSSGFHPIGTSLGFAADLSVLRSRNSVQPTAPPGIADLLSGT